MAVPRDKDARRYYLVAMQRMDEAQQILRRTSLYAAAEHLGGYAVECILKALLIVVTPNSMRPAPGKPTTDWLKSDFGHNLDLLRRGLNARGARMDPDTTRHFLFVATWNPEDRYDPGIGKPERAQRFVQSAEQVLKWASGRM